VQRITATGVERSTLPSPLLLSDPRVVDVARRAPFAHVAIQTSGGPHVTPVLYTLTSDRLWLVVQRATLKARVLASSSRVGILLDAGDETVAIRGEAALIDARTPGSLVALAPELARAPCAVPSYLARNLAELVAFPRDLGLRAPDVVLAAIRPDDVTVLQRPARREGDGDTAELATPGVPEELLALGRTAGPAVVGWEAPGGPLALPAAWLPGQGAALVPAGSVPHGPGAADARVCVCFDETRGRGPAAKAGLLLRGRGRAATTDKGKDEDVAVAVVSVEPHRVTWWDGFEVRTVPFAAALPAAA
jgi:pyridoxamine 5'-phosphate oxidase-like protein